MEKEMQTEYVKPLSFNERLRICMMKRTLRDLYGERIFPPTNISAPIVHGNFRDIGIEAPDRTFYGSHQLVYFRFGNFVYRGHTYETLDGRIEHVPKYPRGIPVTQVRDKPVRSRAEM